MALLNILKQFNCVDIFFVIILIRICYIALKNGFPIESFKFLGTLLASYLALHYFVILSDYTVKHIGAKNIPLEYVSLFSFILLAILGYLVFMLLSKVFSRFIRMEAAPNLNKWGCFILSISRSFLSVSLLIFIFVIAPTDYLKNSVRDSYSGMRLFKVAPAAYTWLWNNVMSKFMTQEKLNGAIFKAEALLTKK